MENNNHSSESKIVSISFGIAIALFVITIGVYVWNFREHIISSQGSDWGTFGDYAGGTLNPILGLFTLFVVIRAYLLQRKELAETKEALSSSAKSSIIKSKIDITSAHLTDGIEKCNRISEDIQRVASTPMSDRGTRWPTYTFSGDNLPAKEISAYIKRRRSTYGKARNLVHSHRRTLKSLQSQLDALEQNT